MLSSVAGFVISFNPSSQADTFRYSGLTFRQNPQGFYSAELGGKLLEFLYRPEDVSDIEVAPSVIDTVTGSRALYMAYDWNSTFSPDIALLQFVRSLGQQRADRTVGQPRIHGKGHVRRRQEFLHREAKHVRHALPAEFLGS